MNEPAREHVPAKTTPTWEMELLISGATIFGLLQLPGLLDHAYFRAANMLPQAYAFLLQAIWLYTKIGVLTLAITFLAHLSLRGFWVALVGLDSVYPGGVRWERLRLGPVARERLAIQPPAEQIADTIERADNRATRVFGSGVALAMLMFAPLLLVLLAFASGWLASGLFGDAYTLHGMLGVPVAFLLPRALAAFADRRLPGLVQRSPRLRHWLGAISDFYRRLGFGIGANPLVALFASHAGRLRFALTAVTLIMIVAITVVSGAHGRLPFGLSIDQLGALDGHSRDAAPAAFYADQRTNPWTILPLPYIPSRVADGPFLPLFVPYLERSHGAALPLACPALRAPRQTPRARLDCLAGMLAIRVDDAPVTVQLEATTDPQTAQAGVLAMIPTGALAPGRHELSLNEPDRRALDGAPLRRYRIPFWK